MADASLPAIPDLLQYQGQVTRRDGLFNCYRGVNGVIMWLPELIYPPPHSFHGERPCVQPPPLLHTITLIYDCG